MSKPWVYSISRNIHFWHDELSIKYSYAGCKKLKLPSFHYARINNTGHGDFFYLETGEYGKDKFNKALEDNFKDKKYINFLENYYISNGEKLVEHSKKLKLDYKEFKDYFTEYGIMCPTLDGTNTGSKIITDYLLNKLSSYPDATDIISYYSQMPKKSPMQKMDEELAKGIKNKVDKKKLAKTLYNKYCWIPISFIGDPWDLKYFEDKIKKYSPNKEHKLSKPKVQIADNLMYYLKLLGKIAYLNEYRKSVFTRANYYIRPLLEKIAQEYNLGTWKEINLLASNEILDLLDGKDDYQKKLIKERRKDWLMYAVGREGIDYVHGKLVKDFRNKFMPKANGLNYVSGTIANKGKVRGVVKIIYEPKDFNKFKKGDILVAKMTSIDFIPIMKRAAAFVTNEGGLACHAAIVSRELNIPCIIGAKIATEVFKDGDRVEVDANRGIVKKIK
ncbi:MAG: PEP-utilizing enzyme [Patescibacteria group bacterium]